MPRPHFSREDFFAYWVDYRSGGKRPLSAGTATTYRSIWSTWCAFLDSHALDWRHITAEDLDSFATSLKPRSKRFKAGSSVAAARYWRTVESIYSVAPFYAVECQREDFANPLAGATPPAGARSEHASSTTLGPQHWAELHALAPEGADWLALRDRSMLLLMLDTACTVSELQLFHLDQILPKDTQGVQRITLRGNRKAQERTLTLGPQAAQALHAWIYARAQLPVTHYGVYVARSGLGTPSSVAIWGSIRRMVTQALERCGDAALHHGPNVIRNAVLLRWLMMGMDPATVARRAGLGSVRKLARLVSLADTPTQERFADAVSLVNLDHLEALVETLELAAA